MLFFSCATMAYDDFIREIVKSHGLAPRLQEKIISIAIRRVNELTINTQDGVYGYVDYLVEKFTQSGEERFLTVSLDSKVGHESDATFMDFLGEQDRNLMAIQNPPAVQPYSNVSDIVNSLRGKLSNADFAVLVQIAREGINPLISSPKEIAIPKDEVMANVPKIMERLEILAAAYERNGKLVIPPRPIVRVQFDPKLYIQFAPRRYNGNPIDFFRANHEAYEGMSRAELADFDKGIYGALLKARQVHLAIPSVSYRHFPQWKIDSIVGAHPRVNGNAEEIARSMALSTRTVVRYWREHGLTEGPKLK
jgi:hypothetical protein